MKLSAINNLFNSLLHSKLVEVFSWSSLGLVALVFFAFMLIFNAYIMLRIGLGHKFTHKFLVWWETASVLFSLVATFTVNYYTGAINQFGKPINYQYGTTATKTAKQSIPEINNKFPYVIILNDSNHTANVDTHYYVFSSSQNIIKNLDTQFDADKPSSLVFLNSDKNTVVVKAHFNNRTGKLDNYKIVKHIGLQSDEWQVTFKNTISLKVNDLEL